MLCLSFVQQDQIAPAVRQQLESQIGLIAREALGGHAAQIRFVWIDVAKGSGYTAGKPSTSSVVGLTVPKGTDDALRARLLRSVCDAWSQTVGCTLDEIVVNASDEGGAPPAA
jgi:hypothetical protein